MVGPGPGGYRPGPPIRAQDAPPPTPPRSGPVRIEADPDLLDQCGDVSPLAGLWAWARRRWPTQADVLSGATERRRQAVEAELARRIRPPDPEPTVPLHALWYWQVEVEGGPTDWRYVVVGRSGEHTVTLSGLGRYDTLARSVADALNDAG